MTRRDLMGLLGRGLAAACVPLSYVAPLTAKRLTARTIFVDGQRGNDGNSGEDFIRAKASLLAALQEAQEGDTIYVSHSHVEGPQVNRAVNAGNRVRLTDCVIRSDGCPVSVLFPSQEEST